MKNVSKHICTTMRNFKLTWRKDSALNS